MADKNPLANKVLTEEILSEYKRTGMLPAYTPTVPQKLTPLQLKQKNDYYTNKSNVPIFHDHHDKQSSVISKTEKRHIKFVRDYCGLEKGTITEVDLGLAIALIQNGHGVLAYPERYETHMTPEDIEKASIETEKAFHYQCKIMREQQAAAGNKKLTSENK